MPGFVMGLLRYRLRRCGFEAMQFSYPSIRRDVKSNAAALARFIASSEVKVIHLVAHSLGGLVIRQMLYDMPELADRIGRIVTLGTPHNGSELARRLSSAFLLHCLLGRSYRHGLDGGVPSWPDGYELGVIAGSTGFGVGTLLGGLPGENDGTVTVAETRLTGASDHAILPVTHTWMQFSGLVAEQTCAFLKRGRFERSESV